MDRATTYDQNGNPVHVDMQVIEARYGKDGPIAREAEKINGINVTSGRIRAASMDSFSKCFYGKMLEQIGVDVVKLMWGPDVQAAFRRKAFKTAAGLAMKRLESKLGRKAAALLIKKISSKLVPGGLPATFAWVGAQCAIKEL